MIKKVIGKNSKSNKKRRQEIFTNVKIRNKIEKIGFFAKIIDIEDKTQKTVNKKKSKKVKNIKLD